MRRMGRVLLSMRTYVLDVSGTEKKEIFWCDRCSDCEFRRARNLNTRLRTKRTEWEKIEGSDARAKTNSFQSNFLAEEFAPAAARRFVRMRV